MDTNEDAVTLEAFAEQVGCHFTTASRLRSGQRLPGRELLGRIVTVYGLDGTKALKAYTMGNAYFGRFLCKEIFGNEWENAPGVGHNSTPVGASNAA